MTELWIALVLTWTPMIERKVDKEFNSEKECWDYYENGQLGESKWGRQTLDHQGRRPDKNFHFKLNWNEYPIRTYNGKDKGFRSTVWLSCERKYARTFNK